MVFVCCWIVLGLVSLVCISFEMRKAPQYPASYDNDHGRARKMRAHSFAKRHAKWDHPHQWKVEV